jgi:hypothetical protein
VETDRDVEDFLENHLEGVCFAEFCNASCNDLTQIPRWRRGAPRSLSAHWFLRRSVHAAEVCGGALDDFSFIFNAKSGTPRDV